MSIISEMERMRIWGADPVENRKALRTYQWDQHRVRVRESRKRIAVPKPGLRCGFCGRPAGAVAKLIQGPPGNVICNECVDVCAGLLERERSAPRTAPNPRDQTAGASDFRQAQ